MYFLDIAVFRGVFRRRNPQRVLRRWVVLGYDVACHDGERRQGLSRVGHGPGPTIVHVRRLSFEVSSGGVC